MTSVEPCISVVVPVWHADREWLPGVLSTLVAHLEVEAIVAIPADELDRYRRIRADHPRVRWVEAPRGRAIQMNAGADVARGEWLVFLHADSRLTPGWPTLLRRASRDPGIVGGSYRLALDSGAWQARVIEAGVRLRVRLLGLPYGDQALFVRRSVFCALGGYRDLPLMEDIDFVRRLKRVGRLLHGDLPVVTSARRWEREGWFRRSARNLWLASLFFCGVSPRTLARRYFNRHRAAVAMMARAPWVSGKSRLSTSLSDSDHVALRMALFHDTLDSIRHVPEVDRFVVCEPPDACDDIRREAGPNVDVIAQQPGDLGERLRHACADLFRLGAKNVVMVGSDLPDLPPELVRWAVTSLDRRGDRVVLGPATDGGYYLVGMKAPHFELFSGIEWGTAAALEQTLDRARQHGIRIDLLPPWHDVDDWPDLERLRAAASPGAVRTRAWLEAVGRPAGEDCEQERRRSRTEFR